MHECNYTRNEWRGASGDNLLKNNNYLTSLRIISIVWKNLQEARMKRNKS